ncbi:hypothetical protein BpHYR1_022400 [Brachionus plicatilis]|uniref:Uncharacterized protein n=1 Tax=Brachionus plicatilis TaxID=10195 RepID=A0A3M7RCY4_BRAPC|nr:hypothetical protein BpHYR1_022400 [Brachionus plicatilis]
MKYIFKVNLGLLTFLYLNFSLLVVLLCCVRNECFQNPLISVYSAVPRNFSVDLCFLLRHHFDRFQDCNAVEFA